MKLIKSAIFSVALSLSQLVLIPIAPASVTATSIYGAASIAGIAEDKSGNIYIADDQSTDASKRGLVVVPSKSGILFGQSVTSGTAFTLAPAADIRGIAVSPSGVIVYCRENGDIYAVSNSSTTLFGASVPANISTKVASKTGLRGGLDFDAEGNLFGVELSTGNISVLPITTGTLYGIPVTANTSRTIFSGTYWFWDLAIDSRGNIFVADGWGQEGVFVLPKTTSTIYGQSLIANTFARVTAFGTAKFAGIDVDKNDVLYANVYSSFTKALSPINQTVFQTNLKANAATTLSDSSGQVDQGLLVLQDGNLISGAISGVLKLVPIPTTTVSNDPISPAQSNETYNLRLTQEPWITQIDSKSFANSLSAPSNWRSFFAYYTSPDEGESHDVLEGKYIGHVTYTLTDSSGSPVPGATVTLKGIGKGHASTLNDVCDSAFVCKKGPAIPIGEAKTTDENGRVTFAYNFQGSWNNPKTFVNIKQGRITNPSALLEFRPEARPNSILKTLCYATCVATETPESRLYNASSNSKGLKPADVFEIELTPSVAGFDEDLIGKDRISIHVINPVQQKPSAVETGDYSFFGVGYASAIGRGNKVGAIAHSDTGLFFGQPFSNVEDFWYACSKPHPKITYNVPKDCAAIPKKYGKEYGIIVPREALNKYVTNGYLITNPLGSLMILLPTAEKVK